MQLTAGEILNFAMFTKPFPTALFGTSGLFINRMLNEKEHRFGGCLEKVAH
jgi:hypothetical protein